MVNQISAVVTGDLIASRKSPASQVDAAMSALADGTKALQETWDIKCHFTRFRGDGWQIHVPNPNAVLDAAIMLLAHLRAADLGIATRAAIAIDTVEHIGTSDLSDATGPAFFRSGDLLENMDRISRLEITGQVTDWHRAIFDLIDFQISRWTPQQAEAISLWLRDGYDTQNDIAQDLNISRQAVQLRLAGAGASHLETPLRVVRNHHYPEDAPHD